LEHDGSLYACDHFVDSDHLIGNIKEKKLRDLAEGPALARFGTAKKDTCPSSASIVKCFYLAMRMSQGPRG